MGLFDDFILVYIPLSVCFLAPYIGCQGEKHLGGSRPALALPHP
jgi:hypothetical protein